MDKNTLSHTTWECKYQIVFAPKCRRQVIYGEIKADKGKILRELCERKDDVVGGLFNAPSGAISTNRLIGG